TIVLGSLSLEDGGKLNNGITNVVGGDVTAGRKLTVQGGAFNSFNGRLKLKAFDLEQLEALINGSHISVAGSTTVTDGSTNLVASFINSDEYRQRFGGIKIDPGSRVAVTGSVGLDRVGLEVGGGFNVG